MIDTRAIATSRNGMDSTTSMSRASTVSTMPPRKPAASPTTTPIDDGEERSRRRRRAARSGRRRRSGRGCRGRGRRCPSQKSPFGRARQAVRRQPGVAVLLVRRVPGDQPRTAARRSPSATISTMTTQRDHRHPVAAQPLPGQRPRAAALDASAATASSALGCGMRASLGSVGSRGASGHGRRADDAPDSLRAAASLGAGAGRDRSRCRRCRGWPARGPRRRVSG